MPSIRHQETTRIWLIGCAMALFSACGGARVDSGPSAAELEWQDAHRAERQGRLDEAEQSYRNQCKREPTYPRACYDLMRLRFDREHTGEARQAAIEFISDYPGNGLASPAVRRLGRSFGEAEVEQGRATLGELVAKVRGSEVEDSLIYEIARLYRRAGRFSDEEQALQQVVQGSGRWESQLWDDALWRLIQLRGKAGDKKGEEQLLERLLSQRERSYILGSYNSPYHDDALLRLGRVRLAGGDTSGAYRVFKELSELETSRLQDDGLLMAARARLQAGREAEACKLIRRLLEKMPETSSARQAAELADELGCRAP